MLDKLKALHLTDRIKVLRVRLKSIQWFDMLLGLVKKPAFVTAVGIFFVLVLERGDIWYLADTAISPDNRSNSTTACTWGSGCNVCTVILEPGRVIQQVCRQRPNVGDATSKFQSRTPTSKNWQMRLIIMSPFNGCRCSSCRISFTSTIGRILLMD